jgi:hypothetical protein
LLDGLLDEASWVLVFLVFLPPLDLILLLPLNVCHHLEFVHLLLKLAHHLELEKMLVWRMMVDLVLELALAVLVGRHP